MHMSELENRQYFYLVKVYIRKPKSLICAFLRAFYKYYFNSKCYKICFSEKNILKAIENENNFVIGDFNCRLECY